MRTALTAWASWQIRRKISSLYSVCLGVSTSAFVVPFLIDVLSRYDPKDPTSASEGLRKRASDLENASTMHRGGNILDGLRIGIPQVSRTRTICDEAIHETNLRI